MAIASNVEMPCTNEAVKEKTGRHWTEWGATLDAKDATKLSHKDLALLIHTEFKVGEWWAQTVAVGYERMRGKRAVGQKCDGNFSASASKTLATSATEVHSFFVEEEKRQRWLEVPIEIRKATAPKSVRITWPDQTSVEVWITAKGDAKCSVSIEHTKLEDQDAVAAQKEFWKAALGRLTEAVK